MQLRQLHTGESDSVNQILKDNGRWMLANGIQQWPPEWLNSIAGDVTNNVASGHFWGFVEGNEILAVVEVQCESEALWGFDSTPSLYVHKLAVNRSVAVPGIGSKLLKAVITRAKREDYTYVRLDCVASNRQLRAFYEGHNFEYEGVRIETDLELALYQLSIRKPV